MYLKRGQKGGPKREAEETFDVPCLAPMAAVHCIMPAMLDTARLPNHRLRRTSFFISEEASSSVLE